MSLKVAFILSPSLGVSLLLYRLIMRRRIIRQQIIRRLQS